MLNQFIFNQIYQNILGLSNKDRLYNLWFIGTNGISSYVELMCTLFDDYAFDEFVDNEIKQIGISTQFEKALIKLRDDLDRYDESNKTQRDIINDPQWEMIMMQAKLVIEFWDSEWKNKII